MFYIGLSEINTCLTVIYYIIREEDLHCQWIGRSSKTIGLSIENINDLCFLALKDTLHRVEQL